MINVPESLLEATSVAPQVTIIGAAFAVFSTILYLRSQKRDDDTASKESSPTKVTKPTRRKLSPRLTEEDSASRSGPAVRSARRKVLISDDAPPEVGQQQLLSGPHLYLRHRGRLVQWLLFFAMVYTALFLPTANRLPAVLDLSWAGLAAPSAPAVEVVLESPVINDVPRDGAVHEEEEEVVVPPAELHVETAEQEQPAAVEEVQPQEEEEEVVPPTTAEEEVVEASAEVVVEEEQAHSNTEHRQEEQAAPPTMGRGAEEQDQAPEMVATEDEKPHMVMLEQPVALEEEQPVVAVEAEEREEQSEAAELQPREERERKEEEEPAEEAVSQEAAEPASHEAASEAAPEAEEEVEESASEPSATVLRPRSVLKVGQAFHNESSPLGNRCFWGEGEEGCTPFHLVLLADGKLQVREGRDVGQGKVRWSARRRPSFDWARRAQGKAEWYELRLTEGGVLELRTGAKAKLRWRSSRKSGAASSEYEAFVDEQGRLTVFLEDLVHWRSR